MRVESGERVNELTIPSLTSFLVTDPAALSSLFPVLEVLGSPSRPSSQALAPLASLEQGKIGLDCPRR